MRGQPVASTRQSAIRAASRREFAFACMAPESPLTYPRFPRYPQAKRLILRLVRLGFHDSFGTWKREFCGKPRKPRPTTSRCESTGFSSENGWAEADGRRRKRCKRAETQVEAARHPKKEPVNDLEVSAEGWKAPTPEREWIAARLRRSQSSAQWGLAAMPAPIYVWGLAVRSASRYKARPSCLAATSADRRTRRALQP